MTNSTAKLSIEPDSSIWHRRNIPSSYFWAGGKTSHVSANEEYEEITTPDKANKEIIVFLFKKFESSSFFVTINPLLK
jgi:hypothetical protein